MSPLPSTQSVPAWFSVTQFFDIQGDLVHSVPITVNIAGTSTEDTLYNLDGSAATNPLPETVDLATGKAGGADPNGNLQFGCAAGMKDLYAATTYIGTIEVTAQDTDLAHTHGAETIAGVKTFSSSPIVPDPTTGTQAANKEYVDSAGGATYATPTISLGTAGAPGAATTGIRSDSTITAFDATAPSTQAFGDAAAVGAAGVAARRDHKHAMPANPTTLDPLIINLRQQGAIGDGAHGTADTAAFNAAIAAINASTNGGEIVVPTPSSTYGPITSSTAFTKPVKIRGAAKGLDGVGCLVTFAAGVTAIDVSATTGSTVEGLMCKGSDGALGTNDGIRLGSRTTVRDSEFQGFGHDGVSGDTWTSGNCNHSTLINVRSYLNWRRGFNIVGQNSNVITKINCEAFNNKDWGHYGIPGTNLVDINPLADANGAAALRGTVTVNDAAFTSASNVMTSATASFVAGDVGSVVLIGDGTLTLGKGAKIIGVTNATTVTLGDYTGAALNATATASGKSVSIVAPGAFYDGGVGTRFIMPYTEVPHQGSWIALDGQYTEFEYGGFNGPSIFAPRYVNYGQRIKAFSTERAPVLMQNLDGAGTTWALGATLGGVNFEDLTLYDNNTGRRYFEASPTGSGTVYIPVSVQAQGANPALVVRSSSGTSNLFIEANASSTANLHFASGTTAIWSWYYTNGSSPLNLYDETNGRNHVIFTPGASNTAAISEFASVVKADGGFQNKGVPASGALSTTTFTSGTGKQISTARDVFLAIPYTPSATGGTLKVELSPDNTTYSTLYTVQPDVAAGVHGMNLSVPAGWWVRLTATSVTIGTATWW